MTDNKRLLYVSQAYSYCDFLQDTNCQIDIDSFYHACYLQDNLQYFKYAIQLITIQYKF